jgi:hypothetical protein
MTARQFETDKSQPQLKDELTGTLVIQTTHTEQADISTTTAPAKTKALPIPGKRSKHRQVAEDVPIETTTPKVLINYKRGARKLTGGNLGPSFQL